MLAMLVLGCSREERANPVEPALDAPADPPAEASAPLATLTLSNPSDFPRVDEATFLVLDGLGVGPGTVSGMAVYDGDAMLPSELVDADGDGDDDSLLFIADYEAAGTRQFRVMPGDGAADGLAKRTQAEVSIKEGGEWDGKVYKGGEFVNVEEVQQPPQYTDHSEFIRYEGPGIESDRVGYRVYLDWRNGFVIFGK